MAAPTRNAPHCRRFRRGRQNRRWGVRSAQRAQPQQPAGRHQDHPRRCPGGCLGPAVQPGGVRLVSAAGGGDVHGRNRHPGGGGGPGTGAGHHRRRAGELPGAHPAGGLARPDGDAVDRGAPAAAVQVAGQPRHRPGGELDAVPGGALRRARCPLRGQPHRRHPGGGAGRIDRERAVLADQPAGGDERGGTATTAADGPAAGDDPPTAQGGAGRRDGAATAGSAADRRGAPVPAAEPVGGG